MKKPKLVQHLEEAIRLQKSLVKNIEQRRKLCRKRLNYLEIEIAKLEKDIRDNPQNI